MPHPKQTPLVAALPKTVPFVGPETQERARGAAFRARLGANENVFGPSPKAIAAMADAAADVWMYADPENHDLKAALAAHHGVAPDNIVVGEGIDALLGYLCRMYVAPDVAVVTSDGAYPTFNFHVAGYGGSLIKVPYRDDREDPDALLSAAAKAAARIIYIANPDNPMGTIHDAATMQAMIAAVPDDTLLILDEAYGEFATTPLPPLDVSRGNVIRFRTFSKAYGMAGARVGYGIAHTDIALAFNKIRNHFGMNRAAVAGAMAALADQDYLNTVLASVAAARRRIAEIAGGVGLDVLPSATNFVAIDCGRDGDFARAVLASLIAQGVFVRMPFVAPQDRCIRISAGREVDLDILAEALPRAVAAARDA